MNGRRSIAALLLALLAAPLWAAELPSVLDEESRALLMGPLAAGDTPLKKEVVTAGKGSAVKHKSPGRALLLSAILPGAGEFYAGAPKRAALFLGIEAAAVGLYFVWDGKGKDVEKEFRKTADENWDPLNYLAWRGSTISRNSSITHALPCSLEVVTGHLDECQSGEKQQYYELLGKYDQFASGWADLVDRDGNPVASPTQVDSVENFHSDLRLAYEDKRDESNKHLKRASNLAGIILINHVLSAIDAARVARSHNQSAHQLERRTRMLFTFHPWGSEQVPMLVAFKPFD